MAMEKSAKSECLWVCGRNDYVSQDGVTNLTGGKLFVEIKGSAKKEWQMLVVVVPVVIKSQRGTAGVNADFLSRA